MNYFLHRIQKSKGVYTKGIEVYDNMDDAVRSFWGRVKTGYNNPQNPDMEFVACKVTDSAGGTYARYDNTWLKHGEIPENVFYFHSIRKENGEVTKAIDVHATLDAAMVAFASAMEYGYNNPNHKTVEYVFCEITDMLSGGMVLAEDRWVKPEEPEE